MVKEFSEAERNLRNVISNAEFVWKDEKYTTGDAIKPKIGGSGGECKTDCYVIATRVSDKQETEIKINYKRENSSFIENKVKSERANRIFGEGWSEIIKSQINQIKKRFLKEPLFYVEKDRRTKEGSIKLGWRYEMEYEGNRSLGVPIKQNIGESVWNNKNADEKYKNCHVNGKLIKNSGVPNYFLQKNEIKSTDDIISNLIPIDDIIKKQSITAAFTAQNYDPFEKRQHGGCNRDLSVPVHWSVRNGMIFPKLVFDKPLEFNSNEQEKKLLDVLDEVGIKIGKNFDIKKFKEKLDPSVRTFP